MMDGTGTPRPHAGEHNLPLDSVRGIAAVCVVLYHVQLSATFREAFGTGAAGLGLFRDGWICVDLFFVLSGIVMAMTYARPGAPFPLRTFAIRRFARLYPLHLAVLLAWVPIRLVRWLAAWAGLAAGAGLAHDVNTPYAFAMQLLLLNAYGTVAEMSWNGPSWSISAEVFAYGVFALVLAWPAGAGRPVPAFAALAAASLLVAVFVLGEGALDFNLRFGIVRCLYGFSIGVVALCAADALRARRGPATCGSATWGSATWGTAASATSAWGALQWGLAALALAVVAAVGTHPGIGFAAPLAFALLLGSLVVAPEASLGRVLSAAPLVWLGRRSYSVYMVHALVIVLAEYLCRGVGFGRVRALDALAGGALPAVAAAAIVAAVLALSDLTFRAIERPGARRVLDWFGGPRRTPSSPALTLRARR